jgi:hypothetical protein
MVAGGAVADRGARRALASAASDVRCRASSSGRLRELQDAGILAADREPGRQEVWYHLTPAGADLGPVIDALN